MSTYTHPILRHPDPEWMDGALIYDMQEKRIADSQEVWPKGVVETDLEKYLRDLRQMDVVRRKLGIPEMSYGAFVFSILELKPTKVIEVLEQARARWETRYWINPETLHVLLCIADPVITEDACWDFYLLGKRILGRETTFSAPAWWEFCIFGVPVPPDWKLSVQGQAVYLDSPEGRYRGMIWRP